MTVSLTSFGPFRGQLVEVSCACCGREEPRRLIYRDREGIGYFRCGACRLLYASPRFDDESLQNIYETAEFADLSDFDDWSLEKWENKRDRSYFVEHHKMDLLAAQVPAGARVLDVGAGTGLFVSLAIKRGYRAEALEPSSMLARVAREKVGIPVTNSGIFDFAPDHLFHAVFLWDVLEHLAYPRAVLARIASLMEPGGVLFVQVPHYRGLSERYKTWLCRFGLRRTYKNFGFPWHLYSFDRASLGRLMHVSGFSPLLFESWSHQMKDGHSGILTRAVIRLSRRYCLTDYLVGVARVEK